MTRRWLMSSNESSLGLLTRTRSFSVVYHVFMEKSPSKCCSAVQAIYHSIELEILHRMVYDSSVAYVIERIVIRITDQKLGIFLGLPGFC